MQLSFLYPPVLGLGRGGERLEVREKEINKTLKYLKLMIYLIHRDSFPSKYLNSTISKEPSLVSLGVPLGEGKVTRNRKG